MSQNGDNTQQQEVVEGQQPDVQESSPEQQQLEEAHEAGEVEHDDQMIE